MTKQDVKNVSMHLRMSNKTKQQLDTLADNDDRTPVDMIRVLIKRAFDELDPT